MRPGNPFRYSSSGLIGAMLLITAFLCTLVAGCSKKEPKSRKEKYARHYNLGIEAYKAGKFDKAIDNFEKALEVEKGNYDLYLMLATVYEDRYRDDDVRKLEALKQAVNYYQMFLDRSDDAEKKRRVKKWAENCKREFIALDERIESRELDTEEATDREKTVEETKARIDKIYDRIDAIYERKLNRMALEAKIEKLELDKKKLAASVDDGAEDRSRLSPFGWVILGTLGAVVLALIYALRHTPSVTSVAGKAGETKTRTIPA